jgi:putative membrane protein (TIGR04086 family)
MHSLVLNVVRIRTVWAGCLAKRTLTATEKEVMHVAPDAAKNRNAVPSLPGQMLNDLIAAAIAIALTLIVFLVLALIWLGGNMEPATAGIAVQVTKIVSLFVAGILAARFNRGNGWINGIAAGVVYTLLAWAVLTLFTQWTTAGQRVWIDLLIAVGAGAAGGMIGMLFTR